MVRRVPSPPTVGFTCPLCLAAGRDVLITAELEAAIVGRIVGDVTGCPHAEVFGECTGLTLGEQWALIESVGNITDPARAGIRGIKSGS